MADLVRARLYVHTQLSCTHDFKIYARVARLLIHHPGEQTKFETNRKKGAKGNNNNNKVTEEKHTKFYAQNNIQNSIQFLAWFGLAAVMVHAVSFAFALYSIQVIRHFSPFLFRIQM